MRTMVMAMPMRSLVSRVTRAPASPAGNRIVARDVCASRLCGVRRRLVVSRSEPGSAGQSWSRRPAEAPRGGCGSRLIGPTAAHRRSACRRAMSRAVRARPAGPAWAGIRACVHRARLLLPVSSHYVSFRRLSRSLALGRKGGCMLLQRLRMVDCGCTRRSRPRRMVSRGCSRGQRMVLKTLPQWRFARLRNRPLNGKTRVGIRR